MPNPRRLSKQEVFARDVEVAAAASRFGDLIYVAMQEAGVSRAELARRIGVSPSAISQDLSQHNPQLSTLVEILFELGYRLDLNIVRRDQYEPRRVPITAEFEQAEAESSEHDTRLFNESTGATRWA